MFTWCCQPTSAKRYVNWYSTCFYYHQNQNTTGCMNIMLANFLRDYTIWEGCYASVYFQVKFDQIRRLLRKHSWLIEIIALWSHTSIYCPIVIGLYKPAQSPALKTTLAQTFQSFQITCTSQHDATHVYFDIRQLSCFLCTYSALIIATKKKKQILSSPWCADSDGNMAALNGRYAQAKHLWLF